MYERASDRFVNIRSPAVNALCFS